MSDVAADSSESETPGMSVPLAPQPRIWLRASILGLLAALVSIGHAPWSTCIGFCVMMAGFLGTFPRATINAEYFDKEWFAFFVPVGISRTRVAHVVRIETDLESRMGLFGGAILSWFIGLFNVLFIWALDWLIPWMGGDYKLWFRMHADHSERRVLVWQGNGEGNFRYNMELLAKITGMPVTRS